MQTVKVDTQGNLYTVAFVFHEGDVATFDIDGTEENGLVDTSCHCAFYASGLYETTYPNGETRTRFPGQTGSEDDIGAKGKHVYPAGQLKIKALKPGRIIFILQTVKTHAMEWGYEANPKAQYHVDLDGNFTDDGPFWFDLVKK